MRSHFGKRKSDREFEEAPRELSAGTVTRVAQQRHDPERVSLFIDDEFAFGLTLELAIREGLKKGVELSVEAQQTLLDDEKGHRARAVALNYVDYQARTVEEVRRKLREKGYNTEDSENAIQHLLDYGFLDDEAYSKSFVRSRFDGSGYGPRRLSADLFKRGIDRGIVDRVLFDAFQDEELRESASRQGRKRWAALERETDLRKRKKKVMDFLVRRGFDYGLAKDVVDAVAEGQDSP